MIEQISKKYPEHAWELVSRRPFRTVFRLVREGAAEYYVKLYDRARFRERLMSLLKPRMPHEALMLWQLGLSGMPVPVVKDHMHGRNAGALITQAIFPARGLHAEDPGRQAQVMLGLSLDLINHGYHFTDMHARNIVVNGSGKAFLVDAHGIRLCRRITMENAAALFAQVARICSLRERDLEPYLEKIDAITDLGRLKERIRSLSGATGGTIGRGLDMLAGLVR
jgi:hypothetical protein